MYPSRQRETTIDRFSAQGFTLLELLVVVVIVGILLTYATLAIRGNSPEEQIQEEAQRFEQLVRLAMEEAILRGEDYGIEFELNGYQFVRKMERRWIPLSSDKIFRYRSLPENMEIELILADQLANIDPVEADLERNDSDEESDDSSEDESEEAKNFKPQAYLYSSEEIDPAFSVRFYILGVETSYLVNGLFDGTVNSEVSDL